MKREKELNAKGVGAGLVSAQKERGITLIALVITIIVLLILAGVTIAMVVGDNGILTRARGAKEETVKAEFYEKVETQLATSAIDDVIGDKTEKSLGEILLEMQDSGDIKNYDKDKQEVNIDGNVTVSVVDTVKKVGDGKWLQAGTLITNGDENLIITAGDKINYNPNITSSTSVTLTMAETGHSEDQTISLKADGEADELEWIVIGAENGKLVIAPTASVTSNNIALAGQNGYANVIGVLDKISWEYGKGAGAVSARSIKVEDLNRITLYRPEKSGYGKGELYEYGNEVTFFWNGHTNPSYTLTNGAEDTLINNHNSKFYWYDRGWKESDKPSDTTVTQQAITTLKSIYYSYYPNTLTTSNESSEGEGIDQTSNIYTGLFNNKAYWLGSQYIYTYTGNVDFGVRYVGADENSSVDFIRGHCLFGSNYYMNTYNYGVRPIVYLKSDIQIMKSNDSWTILES